MYTQCPHCQAYFEVTAEQLKIGDGEVRCGQCLSVFNAVQNLSETLPAPEEENASLYAEWVKSNPPPPKPEPEAPEEPAAPPSPASHIEPTLGDIETVAADIDPRLEVADEELTPASGLETAVTVEEAPRQEGTEEETRAFTGQQIETVQAPADRPSEEPEKDLADDAMAVNENRGQEEVAVTDHEEAIPAGSAAREIYAEPIGTPPADATVDEGDSAASNLPAPLLRQLQEEKAASLRPPATPWVIGSLLMVLVFLAQASYFYRDELAQRKPELRPWLEQACDVLGCSLRRPPAKARIDILGWDVRTLPDIPQALMASTTLVNKTPEPQPYPLLTLRFSDMNGKVVAQRRFLPREYLPPGTDIKAGMPPDTPVAVELALVDPGDRAVNFEFHTEPTDLAQ